MLAADDLAHDRATLDIDYFRVPPHCHEIRVRADTIGMASFAVESENQDLAVEIASDAFAVRECVLHADFVIPRNELVFRE